MMLLGPLDVLGVPTRRRQNQHAVDACWDVITLGEPQALRRIHSGYGSLLRCGFGLRFVGGIVLPDSRVTDDIFRATVIQRPLAEFAPHVADAEHQDFTPSTRRLIYMLQHHGLPAKMKRRRKGRLLPYGGVTK